MSEVMRNPFIINRVLDFVIALFPEEEENQMSEGNPVPNESKWDKVMRLIGHVHSERTRDKVLRPIEEGDKGMSTERVITVVHCGEQPGRMFNDRISIEFSPSELSSLKRLFKKLALEAKDYDTQTEMREMRESFDRAYCMWDAYERGGNQGEDL